jgi:hypothetical protein
MRIFQKPVAVLTLAGLLVGLSLPTVSTAMTPLRGAPQVISGTGDSVPVLSPIDEPVIITFTHDGASNFIVEPIGKDGKEGFSWTNEIGPYTGTVFQEMNDLFAPYSKKNPIVAASVRADGNWSMQIRKLSAAPKKGLKAGTGTGDSVIGFTKVPTGFTRITLRHDGSSNFVVYPIDKKGKAGSYLVNEIGAYSGTVRLPAGTKYLWFKSDGPWSYKTK